MINIDHNPLETENGVWTPPFLGVEFLVSHVSCMDFQRKLARLQQPYAKQIERGSLPPDRQKEILCKAMSGTIVRDWRGQMVKTDGTPIPFDEAICLQVLTTRVDVREFVTEFAGGLDNFRQEEVEGVGKP